MDLLYLTKYSYKIFCQVHTFKALLYISTCAKSGIMVWILCWWDPLLSYKELFTCLVESIVEISRIWRIISVIVNVFFDFLIFFEDPCLYILNSNIWSKYLRANQKKDTYCLSPTRSTITDFCHVQNHLTTQISQLTIYILSSILPDIVKCNTWQC